MLKYSEDDQEEIRRYIVSYVTKTKSKSKNTSANVNEFAEFLKLPVKMKKVSHLETPVEIQWEATRFCNHRCYFCYFRSGMDSNDDILTTDEIKRVIDEASELNVVVFTIEGGEPFMRRDLPDILEYIRGNSDISIDILTNGTLITHKLADTLANILDPGWDRFQVSLVGYDEESHRCVVGRNSFQRVNTGVKALVENGFSVRSNTVITTQNFDHLHDIYYLANDIALNDGFTIALPLYFDDPFYSDTSRTMKAIRSINKALDREKENGGVTIRGIPPFYYIPGIRTIAYDLLADEFGDVNRTGCEGASSKININFNGDVYPCVFLQYDEFKMGNVKTGRIKDIWTTPENNSYVFREGRACSSHKCGECEISPFCAGGCFGATYYKLKSFSGPDPRCEWRI